MDFLKTFDARTAAETPVEHHILDQETGEPISDGKTPCIVLIKGASSRSAQAALRAEEIDRIKALKAARAAKGKGDGKGDPEDEAKATEDLHKTLCRGAARYIVGFRGMETTGADGKSRPMGVEDIDAFLDMTFISIPHLMREQNAPVQAEDETDAAFAMRKEAHKNEWLKPSFAQQILDVARNDARFLTRSAKA